MGLLKNTFCIINFLHLGGNFQLTERMEAKSNKYPRCITVISSQKLIHYF